MLPKRTFAHIPVKITLLLAGGAIAVASFAGAPASGAARQPGDPARAEPPARLARTVPAQAIALTADIAPAEAAQPPQAPQAPQTAQLTDKSVTPSGKPGKPPGKLIREPRPRRHGHRHHGHRPHRRPGHRQHHGRRHHQQHRHRQHHGRRHHQHARRHRIHRMPHRPQRIAWSLLTAFHWAHWQFRYLDLLWIRESGWNRFACNPYSGAYGIPQALPASKMASAGPDWRSNARTQILWGMGYIRGRYVTPYQAWLHEVRYGWY